MPTSQGCVSGENRTWQVAKIQTLFGVLRNIVISGLCFLSPLIFEGEGGLSFPPHLCPPSPPCTEKRITLPAQPGHRVGTGLWFTYLSSGPGALLSSLHFSHIPPRGPEWPVLCRGVWCSLPATPL